MFYTYRNSISFSFAHTSLSECISSVCNLVSDNGCHSQSIYPRWWFVSPEAFFILTFWIKDRQKGTVEALKIDLVALSSVLQSRKYFSGAALKEIVNRAEPCKFDIHLGSRILWHKRIIPSFKKRKFWCLILTGDFPPQFLPARLCNAISLKAAYFHRKKAFDEEC